MAIDLTGQTFGRLTVVARCAPHGNSRAAWWTCSCACGGVAEVRGDCLKSGNSTSCGCFKRECAADVGHANATHGRTGTREYAAWCGMWTRCTNKNRADYADYGARGITVCARWESFENFLEDMGPRPRGGSLDRKDNAKGYSPENCRWTTAKDQARNRRSCRVVEIDGKSATLAEWSEKTGLSQDVLGARLRLGWKGDRLLAPTRKRRPA